MHAVYQALAKCAFAGEKRPEKLYAPGLRRFRSALELQLFDEPSRLAESACLGFTAIAIARSELSVPHGWTVWGALVVTGIFASALALVIQTWAQKRTSATRTALAFAAEPVFAAFFGYLLAGDRLGAVGWSGCALILAGIVISEPAAARAFRSAVRRAPI